MGVYYVGGYFKDKRTVIGCTNLISTLVVIELYREREFIRSMLLYFSSITCFQTLPKPIHC